jgi:tRNA 2-thiocytidine biosynthesis protein TtcA
LSETTPFNSRPFRKACKLAAQASKKYDMLAAGDRLLLGISGGEDSLLLMHIMTRLQKRAPFHFELLPAFIDLSFTSVNRAALRQYALAQGWQLHWQCIDGAALLKEKNAEQRPCSLCSRLRRGQLHQLADQLGCNKIVLGHHLDDLCCSLLMSLFRGGGLKTMGPNVAADNSSKRLLRPLCLLSKAELHAAAKPFLFPPIKSCPYEEALQKKGDRAYLERLLEQLEEQFPNLRGAMLHSMSDLRLAHLLDPRYMKLEKDPDKGKL